MDSVERLEVVAVGLLYSWIRYLASLRDANAPFVYGRGTKREFCWHSCPVCIYEAEGTGIVIEAS